MKLESKDRVYKLVRKGAPLSCIIPSRNTKRKPLLYFDKDKNQNRALRYSRNQNSPFEDEQDGNVIVEPIIFEDGLLRVPSSNPVLQAFLHYHPLNGRKFVEVDKSKDAIEEVERMNIESEALMEARQADLDTLEMLGRVLFSRDVTLMSTAELKRDVMVFAKKNPEAFLNALSNPEMKMKSTVQSFFDNKLLGFRNKGREVYFNLPDNKKRMLSIPFGATPIDYIADWFKSEVGREAYDFLESLL